MGDYSYEEEYMQAKKDAEYWESAYKRLSAEAKRLREVIRKDDFENQLADALVKLVADKYITEDKLDVKSFDSVNNAIVIEGKHVLFEQMTSVWWNKTGERMREELDKNRSAEYAVQKALDGGELYSPDFVAMLSDCFMQCHKDLRETIINGDTDRKQDYLHEIDCISEVAGVLSHYKGYSEIRDELALKLSDKEEFLSVVHEVSDYSKPDNFKSIAEAAFMVLGNYADKLKHTKKKTDNQLLSAEEAEKQEKELNSGVCEVLIYQEKEHIKWLDGSTKNILADATLDYLKEHNLCSDFASRDKMKNLLFEVESEYRHSDPDCSVETNIEFAVNKCKRRAMQPQMATRQARLYNNAQYNGVIIRLKNGSVVQRWEDNGKVHGFIEHDFRRLDFDKSPNLATKMLLGEVPMNIKYNNGIGVVTELVVDKVRGKER